MKIAMITNHTRYEDYLHYIPFLQDSHKASPVKKKAAQYVREKFLPRYFKSFTNQCDRILAPTPSIQQMLLERGTRTPVSVLPTGLEEASYHPDSRISHAIREKYLEGRKFLFCTVSRLEQEKNLTFLFRGIRRLKDMTGDTFRVLLLGDGSMGKELRRYAAELGIEDNICFLGCIPNEEIVHYQAASDVFLFASKTETQGIVLLEAMAAGTPVVAVNASGTADLVKNFVNGFTTPEKEEDWAFGVYTLMKSPDLRTHLSHGAQKTAGQYRASCIALEAETAYTAIASPERRTWNVEREPHPLGKNHTMSSLLRLFKAS